MSNKSTYLPFARKYRPSNFSELLGQEVLVKTLSYCIENERLSQAHLLTGIRGVGKTSSARIIAKTVNCTNLQKSESIAEPCEKCENCESFNKHSHPDILEIDAASRTSVDDIREIIESAEYRPLIGRKKFFIIDEIHMLSKSAFNALLKIVEEPPEHVIFIFATTEVQKIPLTVISRCQRYDLRRLNFEEILELTSSIAKKEDIKFEKRALEIIASKSEGSARDAVSILDQASSYLHNASEETTISASLVEQMLGLLNTKTIIELVQLIIANDPTKALNLLQEIYANANSLEHLVRALSDFLAELSKSKAVTNYHNPIYSNFEKEITTILVGTQLDKLTILWQIFQNGLIDIKQSHNELITCEMIILKAIYACNLPSTDDIIAAESTITSAPQEISAEEQPLLDISKFLKYCHKQKEIECYYLLLNEVEIVEFSNAQLEIAGSATNEQISSIKNNLNKWSGAEYNVIHKKQKDIISLKDTLIQKATEAEDYRVIKKYFPDANISDIILPNK